MGISNLPAGENYPDEFNVVVEIPRGSRNKYEYSEDLDVIKLDRVYYTAMTPPFEYGFIPQTRSADGDHLDVVLVMGTSVAPGIVVEARAIGVIKMIDNGEEDEKIVAVPVKDPRFVHVATVEDLSGYFTKEVQHYFEHYKDLENKRVEITGWGDKEEAIKVLKQSLESK